MFFDNRAKEGERETRFFPTSFKGCGWTNLQAALFLLFLCLREKIRRLWRTVRQYGWASASERDLKE